MALEDIPLFSMLKSRLGYLNERQNLISRNVANSDTPGYTPSDLAPFTVKGMGDGSGGLAMTQVAPTTTQPGHMAGKAAKAKPWQAGKAPDSETRLDGNQVVLEEEMMKMSDARMNYAAAIGFYEKSLNMLQLAIKIPGK